MTKEYYDNHKKEILQRKKEYYLANREKILEQKKSRAVKDRANEIRRKKRKMQWGGKQRLRGRKRYWACRQRIDEGFESSQLMMMMRGFSYKKERIQSYKQLKKDYEYFKKQGMQVAA